MDADLAQLLRSGLCDVDAFLLAGHDADREGQLLAAAGIEAVRAQRAARVLEDGARLVGVIVVVLDALVVVDVPLQPAVGGMPSPRRTESTIACRSMA